jgi:F-type H+-transporting ATPase subunit epsilon
MATNLMQLKILLPFGVFNETKNVRSIVIETSAGSYGFLPQRLDCVAALVPGIFSYQTETVHYIAIDQGILVKVGSDVLISVRNAFAGAELGKLRESVEKEFLNLEEKERDVRTMMAKMESGFVQTFEKFRKK